MKTVTKPGALDAVTMEILFNALRSVTDETFIALMRSAYSTNIKERRDHSTAICDPDGRLIVQAGMMAAIRTKVPLTEIAEGDLFVANDPHAAGGTHLPDINMAMPVFVGGKLFAFMCNESLGQKLLFLQSLSRRFCVAGVSLR